MMRKCTLLVLVCFGLTGAIKAQFSCGSKEYNQEIQAQNPGYAQLMNQMNTAWANHVAMQQNSPALIVGSNGIQYEIPVVVHVIHTGGAIGTNYNPSDAAINNMIDYLNNAWHAQFAGYPDTNGGGVKIPIRFALAKRSPSCTPTTGILRVDGAAALGADYVNFGVERSSGNGVSDLSLKNLSRWPNTSYVNIWIVNKIDGADGYPGTSGPFVAGYATLPPAPANVDGTVMLASQISPGEITLPHEMGHNFGLYHIFEDGDDVTCPPSGPCATTGDLVCDTDPIKQSTFNCPSPSTTNPCTGNPYAFFPHNFMDYSNCQDRFTPGQRDRILFTLLNTRPTLISSLGSVPVSGAVTTACIPTITNPGNSNNAGPREIKINDASTTYMHVTSSGYNGDGNLVYIDNTCFHQVNLIAGNSYNFSVKTGFNLENLKIFVDYNNDGIFQPSEEIFSSTGTTSNQVHSFSYTVPTTATVPGLISCIPLRMRVISDRTIAPPIDVCGPLGYGQAEDYAIVISGGGPSTGAVSVTLSNGTNPSCFNDPLTFTATPSAGVTPSSYLWFVNGGSTGITTSTFTSSTLTNGDAVSVKMYFTGACGPDSSMSTDFVVIRQATVPPTVTIALTSGTNPGCAGQTLTFTATPTNGGSAPSYQWKVNGINSGTNSPVFSDIFNNNDAITVELTSNSSCASPATATSNSITVTHATLTANVDIAITAGTNPSCTGKPITFEATVTDGGASPQYQWYINGVPVSGATSSTFTTSTLNNNDEVKAEFIATDPCVDNATDTSNIITITINPTDTPAAMITITQGSNPGCLDSLIEFTGTFSGIGGTPNFEWQVNGTAVSNGSIYSSSTLQDGDVVSFIAIANDGGCYTSDTATTSVTLSLTTTPDPPLISFIGNLLVSDIANNIQWYGPSGLISGATGQTYQPTVSGNYYAVVNNNGCSSAPSNTLLISLLHVGGYDLSQVSIYPNPTNGQLILDWKMQNVNMSLDVFTPSGRGVMHEQVRNQSRKVIDMSHLANGVYFVVLRDDQGKTGTVRISLIK